MRLDVVSSLGMVTNVGRDVRTASAAVRAGISRLSPLDVNAFDPDRLEAPVIGAPVVGLTDGFVATGTFVRLAEATLADLMKYGGLPDKDGHGFWRSTMLVWCLPEITHERFMWPEDEVEEILHTACAERLMAVSGLPLATLRTGQLPRGHVGAAEALGRIDALAREARAQRVVLLATDSYLDDMALRLLMDEDRLKSAEAPTGLIPGEAGAAILLEAGDASSACGAQCRILSAASLSVSHPLEDDVATARRAMAAGVGINLATVVRQALDDANCASFEGTAFVDLNGEEWKSVAWGLALMQLKGRVNPELITIELPCSSFGEIGAVSAVAALCLAARGFVGRYAHGDMALVVSMADRGQVSAILAQAVG